MRNRSDVDMLKDLPATTISSLSTEANETGEWRYRKPLIDLEKCNQCGVCWMYCPDTAVRPKGESFTILYKYCKGCGICAEECPKGAILLVSEEP